MIDNPFETARVQSEFFAVQCCQWEPIQNSQLIRKYKKIPVQWQIYRIIETNAHIDTKVNFTFPLTSSGPKWLFHIATDI